MSRVFILLRSSCLCALLLLMAARCNALWHTTFCVVSAPRSRSYLSQVLAGFEAQHAMALDGARLMVVVGTRL